MHDWQLAFVAFEALMALFALMGAVVSTPVVKPAQTPPAECRVLDQETLELVPCPTTTGSTHHTETI
jgi:hypothetical protein